ARELAQRRGARVRRREADDQQARGGKLFERRDRAVEALVLRLTADREPAPMLGRDAERGAAALAAAVAPALPMPALRLEIGRQQRDALGFGVPGAAIAFDLRRAERDDPRMLSGREARAFERTQHAVARGEPAPSGPRRDRRVGAIDEIEPGKLVE